jgi:hypothetical protein
MVDGLHICTWNRSKKPPAIPLSGSERGLMGRDVESSVTNVQYTSNWNCHYESSPYNEYILIKIYKNNNKKTLVGD